MSFPSQPFLEVIKDASGGNTKTQQKDYLSSGPYAIVDQGKDLIGGYTDDVSKLCKIEPPVIVFGDHTRAVKYIDFPFAMGADGTKILVPKKGDDSRYLYHAIKAIKIEEAGYSRHFKFLKESRIPLPSLEEQKRIAKILDAADALRAKRRESLAQLDALLQSTFLDLFGDPVENPNKWKTLPFSEVGSFKSGGTPSKANNLYWGKGFPWVSPKDMKVDRVYESKDSITSLALSETNMRLVDPGHILIVVRGMILAHSFPVAVNNVSVAINQDMKAIWPIESINSDYLLYCLKAKKREIMDLVSSAGHGTRRFDRNAMNELQVPIPDIALQEKFSIFCNYFYKQKIGLVKYAEELNGLFGALQTKAFSGEL